MHSGKTSPPRASNKTGHWQAADARHHIHPFTDQHALKEKGVRVITHGEGIYVWDSEGNRLLDAMAGLWCCQLGYGNEELVQAGAEALRQLPYYNTFFQTTHPQVVELGEKLAEITPEGLDTFFFANSGSEANDSAVKLIRYYWNLQGRKNKKIILSRNLSYHGTTMAAASLSGLPYMHPQFDLPLPGFEHVGPAPYWYDEGGDLSPDDFGLVVARAVENAIVKLGPDNVAAFIGEPVMGAGGLIIPPDTYWQEVEKICRKYDVLLWADEVICGFGRTGAWFGCQTYGFQPDLITMAKGLSSGYQPISALALGPRMGEAINNAHEELEHGFTYSGHPVACAVALRNIEIMQRLDLVGETGRAVAAYFQQKLGTLADHPLVGEVRGVGFLAAIEIVADKATRRRFQDPGKAGSLCRDFCFQNGLIMRAVRDTMILSPPLILSKLEVDELVDAARRCLDLTAAELSKD